jgi:SP family facilitated glucose transporter-like MFS transporter 3
LLPQLYRINAVFYYSGLFFDGVIDNPLVGTTLMGAVNVLATAAALLLMDRCGRRTLIMWSSAGMFLSCIVIVLALLNFFSKTVAIAGVASYVTFFEIGLGPIPVSTFLTGNSIYALNIALTYIYTFPFSGLL